MAGHTDGQPPAQAVAQPTGQQPGTQEDISPELGDASFAFNLGLGFLRILQDPRSAKNLGNLISQAAVTTQQQQGTAQGVAPQPAGVQAGGQAGVPFGSQPTAAGGGQGADVFKQLASMGAAASTGGLDLTQKAGRNLNQVAQGSMGALSRARGTI